MPWILACPKCGNDREFRHYASYWAAGKNKSACHRCAGYNNKPGVRLTSEQVMKLLLLHKEGKTNRGIAKELNVHHNTVAAILKKHGLACNGPKRHKLDRLGDGTARCSKCGGIRPEREFLVNRRGEKYEYPLSYCSACRRGRDYLVINASQERYVHRVFMHLRRRAKKEGTPCTVTKEHIWHLFQRQGGNCFYTDAPMRCRVGEGASSESLSVDKLEPASGYVFGNVVLCTRRANTIKSDMTLGEMKRWMPGWHARVEKFLAQRTGLAASKQV